MKKLIKVFTLGSLVLGMTSNIAMADSVLVKPMLEDPNIKLGIVQDDSLQEEKINYMSFEGYVKDFENKNGYMSIIMNNGKTDEVIGEFRIFEDIIIVNQDTAESITVDKIEVDYMYNQNKFQQALLMYQENKDTYAFADKILPEMIISPTELKNRNTFVEDFESLGELLALLVGMQSKKPRAHLKKKTAILKMQ